MGLCKTTCEEAVLLVLLEYGDSSVLNIWYYYTVIKFLCADLWFTKRQAGRPLI